MKSTLLDNEVIDIYIKAQGKLKRELKGGSLEDHVWFVTLGIMWASRSSSFIVMSIQRTWR